MPFKTEAYDAGSMKNSFYQETTFMIRLTADRMWDKILLCCSAKSLRSWWVDNEIAKAFAKERQIMQERGRRILAQVPLDLDGYLFEWQDGKADEIRRRYAADFKSWDSNRTKFERGVESIIQCLRADDGARDRLPISQL